ncbi:MAG TPA: hypothetical protein PLN52_23745 [Opitutaceae bacterium]|nr:hypothetical protein [Opitutaceae bacterium]
MPATVPALSGPARSLADQALYQCGQTTSIAALQTMAGACDQGDVETMAGLILIDEEV